HHQETGADRDRAEPQQQHVGHGHPAAPFSPVLPSAASLSAAAACRAIAFCAAASSLAGSPLGSCAGGGGTVAIHSPRRSCSCSRSRMSYSAYSNSGDQNSASNGHTSTQMPQYMQSEKSIANRSSTLRCRGRAAPGTSTVSLWESM